MFISCAVSQTKPWMSLTGNFDLNEISILTGIKNENSRWRRFEEKQPKEKNNMKTT
jgi:hypothetical protein